DHHRRYLGIVEQYPVVANHFGDAVFRSRLPRRILNDISNGREPRARDLVGQVRRMQPADPADADKTNIQDGRIQHALEEVALARAIGLPLAAGLIDRGTLTDLRDRHVPPALIARYARQTIVLNVNDGGAIDPARG